MLVRCLLKSQLTPLGWRLRVAGLRCMQSGWLPQSAFPNHPLSAEAPSDSGGPNVGAIVGPIVAVVVVAAAVAAFIIHRRRSRAFRNFGTPTNSDGPGG